MFIDVVMGTKPRSMRQIRFRYPQDKSMDNLVLGERQRFVVFYG